MTQPSKGVSLSGVSLFGKVPSLTSCFYNNPYMFSIARVFAVANIDIAVHTSQVTAKVRNRCLTISMKLQGNYGRACVCVCVCSHFHPHSYASEKLSCHSSTHNLRISNPSSRALSLNWRIQSCERPENSKLCFSATSRHRLPTLKQI